MNIVIKKKRVSDPVKEIFSELKNSTTNYAKLKLELLKLNTFQKLATLISLIFFFVVVVVLFFCASLFLFLALGSYLNTLFPNTSGIGYFIVASIYLFICFILYLCKNIISTKVQNWILAILLADGEEK